jgi:peptidoglycan-N-acetylglucosamine deacetylase
MNHPAVRSCSSLIMICLALSSLALAQTRQPLPTVQPPGEQQPRAPGQQAARDLPQLTITPAIAEVKKIEFASNGSITVAHALILVPKAEDTLARALQLAQATGERSFKAKANLNEVDLSVYQLESFGGIGGPMPRFTASVPKNWMTSFANLSLATVGTYERAWINPASEASLPKRAPNQVLEQAPVFHGSPRDLTGQQVKQIAAQQSGRSAGGLFFHGDPGNPQAALTFDDTPHPLYEPLLLDTLRRAGIKATFFCIGRNAKAYPYFVRDMIEQGHEVGNHTYHHVRLPQLSDGEVRDELEQANTTLKGISGKPMRFFRPPGGDYSPATLRISKALGLTTAFWTDDPGDFDNLGDAVLESRLLRKLRPGGIVLLHDNVIDTIQVLSAFLRVANQRGISLETLGALAKSSGA